MVAEPLEEVCVCPLTEERRIEGGHHEHFSI